MTSDEIVARFKQEGDPAAVKGLERFGIVCKKAFGVKIPTLRKMALSIGAEHQLALELWEINSRETRVLASMIADPDQTGGAMARSWVADVDSWEICDQCCMNLFRHIPQAPALAVEWAADEREFVKRAGFTLIAQLAVIKKNAPDDFFSDFFPVIIKGATDPRNYVKKGVSWALRQIGKRNPALYHVCRGVALELSASDHIPARWIGREALREFANENLQKRLNIMKKET